MSRWHNYWKNLAGHFPKHKNNDLNGIFTPSIFNHDSSYSTLRQKLGLQSPNYQGVYEPSSSLIILNKVKNGRVPKEQQEDVLRHEIYHSQQLISTTAGLIDLVLISARNNVFRNYIYHLNKTFDAGLWVPDGWMILIRVNPMIGMTQKRHITMSVA